MTPVEFMRTYITSFHGSSAVLTMQIEPSKWLTSVRGFATKNARDIYSGTADGAESMHAFMVNTLAKRHPGVPRTTLYTFRGEAIPNPQSCIWYQPADIR